MYLPQCLSDMIKLHWLTSDLIPGKIEKFEFRPKFCNHKLTKKKETFVCPQNEIQNLRMGDLKMKIFGKKLIFHQNQRKILIVCVATKKVFDS